jgi:hypothetical protein
MVDVIIDATIGGLAPNSYITEAAANAYFDLHFTPNPFLKAQNPRVLLTHSTRLLDFYMDWDGVRFQDETLQSLDWPRYQVLDVLSDIIPQRVKDAVCELSSYLATNGVSTDLAEVNKIRVGPITLDLDSDGSGFLLPPQVTRMLNHLGSAKSLPKNSISTVALVR